MPTPPGHLIRDAPARFRTPSPLRWSGAGGAGRCGSPNRATSTHPRWCGVAAELARARSRAGGDDERERGALYLVALERERRARRRRRGRARVENHYDHFFGGRGVADVARHMGLGSTSYRIADATADQLPLGTRQPGGHRRIRHSGLEGSRGSGLRTRGTRGARAPRNEEARRRGRVGRPGRAPGGHGEPGEVRLPRDSADGSGFSGRGNLPSRAGPAATAFTSGPTFGRRRAPSGVGATSVPAWPCARGPARQDACPAPASQIRRVLPARRPDSDGCPASRSQVGQDGTADEAIVEKPRR